MCVCWFLQPHCPITCSANKIKSETFMISRKKEHSCNFFHHLQQLAPDVKHFFFAMIRFITRRQSHGIDIELWDKEKSRLMYQIPLNIKNKFLVIWSDVSLFLAPTPPSDLKFNHFWINLFHGKCRIHKLFCYESEWVRKKSRRNRRLKGMIF